MVDFNNLTPAGIRTSGSDSADEITQKTSSESLIGSPPKVIASSMEAKLIKESKKVEKAHLRQLKNKRKSASLAAKKSLKTGAKNYKAKLKAENKTERKVESSFKKWIHFERGKREFENSKNPTVLTNLKRDIVLTTYTLPKAGLENFLGAVEELIHAQKKATDAGGESTMVKKNALDRLEDISQVGLAAIVLPLYTTTYVIAAPLLAPVYLAASAFQAAARNFRQAKASGQLGDLT